MLWRIMKESIEVHKLHIDFLININTIFSSSSNYINLFNMYKVLNSNIKQSSPKLHKLLNIWWKLFNEVNFYLRRKFVFRWTSFKESKTNNNKTNHLIKRNYLKELHLEWREILVWKKHKRALFRIWTEIQISKKEFKKLCWDYDNWDNPWISYQDLYKEVKEISTNYTKLPPQVSQQILKQAINNFTSFYKVKAINPGAQLPKYKKWNKFKLKAHQLQFPQQSFKVLTLKWTPKLRLSTKSQLNSYTYLNISQEIYKQIIDWHIILQEVRIIPSWINYSYSLIYKLNDNRNIHWITNKEHSLSWNKWILSIDLWVKNLASLLNVKSGAWLLIRGTGFLSHMKYLMNKIERLSSQLEKMDKRRKMSYQIQRLWTKRNNYTNNFLHHISKYIINYCLDNDIWTIIIGYNKDWKSNLKQEKKLVKQVRKDFVVIPHKRLIDKISYKAFNNWINVVLTNESYTSKIDHIAWEDLSHQESYLWKRVSRWLYKSSTWIELNADINGCLWMLRKMKNVWETNTKWEDESWISLLWWYDKEESYDILENIKLSSNIAWTLLRRWILSKGFVSYPSRVYV